MIFIINNSENATSWSGAFFNNKIMIDGAIHDISHLMYKDFDSEELKNKYFAVIEPWLFAEVEARYKVIDVNEAKQTILNLLEDEKAKQ